MRCLASPTDLLRRLALPALLLLAALRPADGAEDIVKGSEIVAGSWDGGAFVDETGAFLSCLVVARYGASTLGIALYKNAAIALFLDNDGWSVTKGSRNPVTLAIDGASRRAVTAEGLGSNGYILELGVDRAFLEALGRGRTLDVVAGGGTIPFALTNGGATAARALEPCLQRYAGLDATGNPGGGGTSTNPIESGQGPEGSGAPAAGTAEQNPFAPATAGGAPLPSAAATAADPMQAVIEVLRDILVASGYRGPVFTVLGESSLSWSSPYSGIVGLYNSMGPVPDGTVKGLQRALTGLQSDRCAAPRQVTWDPISTVEGTTIYGGRMSCGGGRNYVFFLAFEFPDGVGLMLHDVPGSELTFGQRLNANLRSSF
jgi:hypothetical protein